MPWGTLKKFVCLAKTCILTDTPEMSTDRSFVEEVMTDFDLPGQHHRHLLTPYSLKRRKGIYIDDIHLETELLPERLECVQQVVTQMAPLPAQYGQLAPSDQGYESARKSADLRAGSKE